MFCAPCVGFHLDNQPAFLQCEEKKKELKDVQNINLETAKNLMKIEEIRKTKLQNT